MPTKCLDRLHHVCHRARSGPRSGAVLACWQCCRPPWRVASRTACSQMVNSAIPVLIDLCRRLHRVDRLPDASRHWFSLAASVHHDGGSIGFGLWFMWPSSCSRRSRFPESKPKDQGDDNCDGSDDETDDPSPSGRLK